MDILLPALLKFGFFLFDRAVGFILNIRPLNPKILESKVYAKGHNKLMKLMEEKKKMPDSASEDYKQVVVYPKIRRCADIYSFRADIYWGRSFINMYKSAWFYVLAGEAYEITENYRDAGFKYHHAAHAFRNVGEFEKASKYYDKSGVCFEKANLTKLALRSYKRAAAIYLYNLYEPKKAADIRNKLESLINTENQAIADNT